jgi:hypothetical protein
VIPASAVELDEVSWVQHGADQFPDRLDPLGAPVAARANENLLVWVEVEVPRTTTVGTYHGQLLLQTASATREIPLELQVLPFSLPQKPSLATSFSPGRRSGPLGAFARVALRERVTLRLADPPPFRVTPLEGTLQLDFTAFDRALAPLLDDGPTRASSIEIAVPEAVPLPRKLEYLLAVKRHLAERGCADLLVNFGEEGSLLQSVQGSADLPGIALVSMGGDAPRAAPFWWRLGTAANTRHELGALESDASLNLGYAQESLGPGASGYRLRSLGWAAFAAGVAGLYAQDPLALLYQAEDGTPRESVRLKLLRQGLEDYELLQLAARVDPEQAHKIVSEALAPDGGPATRVVDFDAARGKVLKLLSSRRTGLRTAGAP